jgi:hypothetical protein
MVEAISRVPDRSAAVHATLAWVCGCIVTGWKGRTLWLCDMPGWLTRGCVCGGGSMLALRAVMACLVLDLAHAHRGINPDIRELVVCWNAHTDNNASWLMQRWAGSELQGGAAGWPAFRDTNPGVFSI